MLSKNIEYYQNYKEIERAKEKSTEAEYDWTDITNIFNKAKSSKKYTLNTLLIYLYYFAPNRNDYKSVKLMQPPAEAYEEGYKHKFNYYHNGKFYMFNSKGLSITMSDDVPVVTDFPKELKKYIDVYINKNKLTEFLIEEPDVGKLISKAFKDYGLDGVTFSGLRSAWMSSIEFSSQTIPSQINELNRMNTSANTMRSSYKRPVKK